MEVCITEASITGVSTNRGEFSLLTTLSVDPLRSHSTHVVSDQISGRRKRGGQVRHHFLCNNLHRLTFESVPPDELLAD